MCWLGWCGNQVIVDVGLVWWKVDVFVVGQLYFWGVGWIGVVCLFLQNVGGGQQLGVMVDCGDWFVCGIEVMYQSQYLFVQVQVFGCVVVGDQQGIVIFGVGLGKVGIEGEVVVWFFVVGLVVFEIVDGGVYVLFGLFVWIYCMYLVVYYLQGLEWDYGFVVFGIVVDQYQDFFCSYYVYFFGQGLVILGMYLRQLICRGMWVIDGYYMCVGFRC